MCNSSSVLGRIASKWKAPGLFASDELNTIGNLVVEYHQRVGEAPGQIIVTLVRTWAEKENQPETKVSAVEKVLAGIVDETEVLHETHALDLAAHVFNKVRLERLSENIKQATEAGQLDRAFAEIAEKGSTFELGVGAGVDPLTDPAVVESWFAENKKEVLIKYPGDAGIFFGDIFYRGAFVALEAPEKGLKSSWMVDLAYRGVRNRQRVAYFDVGDSTEDEIGIRLEERFCCRPHRSTTENRKWPCKIKVPTLIRWQTGYKVAKVEFEEKEIDGPLSAALVNELNQDFMNKKVKSKESKFKLSCHPSGTVSVSDLRSILKSWALSGWICDICIIDYSDLLAPSNKRMERRDQINQTWMELRSLSQEFHALIVTGTQARRDAYGQSRISRQHTADDKRKLGHVTSMFGVGMNDLDREASACKLNHIVSRRGSTNRRLHCATCLAIANPCVESYLEGSVSDEE